MCPELKTVEHRRKQVETFFFLSEDGTRIQDNLTGRRFKADREDLHTAHMVMTAGLEEFQRKRDGLLAVVATQDRLVQRHLQFF